MILTYVKVKTKWHYVCIFVDLFNSEIIGEQRCSLVARAFSSIQGDLQEIQLFHTDRGSEFKNHLFDETLEAFQIGRPLSMKNCPYDNAVAEATFKIIKTEFVSQMTFDSLEHLTLEFSYYVNWFNKLRIHGTLGYMSPIEYKLFSLKRIV